MCTNDSSSGRKRKISLPMCLPSNKRSWRDASSFGTRQNTTAEEVYVGEQGAHYTSYKVANILVEFSTSIPRTQLRPGYGDGFLGAPLQIGQRPERPRSQQRGGRRGTSSTHSNTGDSHHV